MFRNLFRIGILEVRRNALKIGVVMPHFKSFKFRTPEIKSNNYRNILIGAGIFTWLGFDKNVEDDIILDIKRSIYWIQQKEYNKAEQMLHLSLRLAQQTFNEPAITYIYDVMANLALQINQLDKAEKLFVNVMQRLLSNGVSESDMRNIHISLKLAHICHLKGDLEKAEIGFKWSFDHLEKWKNNSDDILTLYGIGKDWYGHLLYDLKRHDEALSNLKEAYNILTKLQEDNLEQTIVLLNDMAALYEIVGNLDKAEETIKQAIVIGKKNPEMHDLGAIYVNLGRIYLRKKLYEKARKTCGMGWRISIDRKNKECEEEAKKCIQEAKQYEA